MIPATYGGFNSSNFTPLKKEGAKLHISLQDTVGELILDITFAKFNPILNVSNSISLALISLAKICVGCKLIESIAALIKLPLPAAGSQTISFCSSVPISSFANIASTCPSSRSVATSPSCSCPAETIECNTLAIESPVIFCLPSSYKLTKSVFATETVGVNEATE